MSEHAHDILKENYFPIGEYSLSLYLFKSGVRILRDSVFAFLSIALILRLFPEKHRAISLSLECNSRLFGEAKTQVKEIAKAAKVQGPTAPNFLLSIITV